MLRTWTPNFDATSPIRLTVPPWLSLRGIPREFLSVAREIAKGLGELVGLDKGNDSRAEQRFYMALESGGRWITQLAITNQSNNKQSIIFVDYCNLPVRCQNCMATNHLVKECLRIRGIGASANSSDGDQSIEEADVEDGSSNSLRKGIDPTKGGDQRTELKQASPKQN